MKVNMRSLDLSCSDSTIILGGGIIGLSTAFYFSRANRYDQSNMLLSAITFSWLILQLYCALELPVRAKGYSATSVSMTM